MDFLKIKSSCSSEDTVKKIKRQAKGQKKITAKHIFDKGFVPGIQNKLWQDKQSNLKSG